MMILNENVAGVVKDLVDMFDSGKVVKCMVVIENADGEIIYQIAGFKYLEKYGIAKMIEADTTHFVYNDKDGNS